LQRLGFSFPFDQSSDILASGAILLPVADTLIIPSCTQSIHVYDQRERERERREAAELSHWSDMKRPFFQFYLELATLLGTDFWFMLP
jgi:hypothetical protein